jgi:tetratricopeptide (TPR) repeat protein
MLLAVNNNLQIIIDIVFAVLLIVVIYLLIKVIQSKKIKILPTFNKNNRVIAFLIKRKTTLLMLFSVLIALVLGTGATVLAFSYKTKAEGDADYKNMNYVQALAKYQKAEDLWFPERISIKLRDRDLYTKIHNARIMVQSGENYQNGKAAFDKGDYTNAKSYLNSVVENDPNKASAKALLAEITKLLSKKSTPINQPVVTPTQPVTIAPTPEPQPGPTKSDIYPIIIRVSDNLGNYTIGSDGNGISVFTGSKPNPNVKLGQTITITVQAEDPKGQPIQYKMMNNINQTIQDWTSSNTLTWNVSSNTGGEPFIVVFIKSSGHVLRYADNDDSTRLDYLLQQ